MSLIKLIAINRMLYFNLISSINLFHYFMVNLPGLYGDDISVSA